jgi:Lipoprotein LpqB beta-propeller domain
VANGKALRLPGTLAVLVVVAAIAGCASAPSGGPPRRAVGSGTQVQAYVQPLPPPPPTTQWKDPTQVVLGFLHASASYAFDPAAANQYLAPELRKTWHPANGPVAILGPLPPKIRPVAYKPQTQGTVVTVEFNGQQLATLSQTGQYQYTPGQNVQYQFVLAKTGGVWLIDGLPQAQPGLLLTQSDFQSVYQPRNLFFYAPSEPWQGFGVLVPDPVYAPLQSSNSALNTNLATGLVKGLLKGQGDWLSGATSSAFPAGTHLIKQVTITGRVAQVDLGGAAGRAGPDQVQRMWLQLRATLSDRSYSAPLASQVQLYINDTLVPEPDFGLVPQVSAGPVLAVTSPSTVGQLPHDQRSGPVTARVSPEQVGRATITAIATDPMRSRAHEIAVAVPNRSGCAVIVPAGGRAPPQPHVLSTSGGPCTSLSWDNSGNLWAAAGQDVWVLGPQSRRPAAVDLSKLTAIGPSGSQILALRMAPDSVRAALLVHTKSGNKLLLAAARFGHGSVAFGPPVSIGAPPDAAEPIAISWLDPYHLAVLANGVIFQVPLTGGAGIQPGGSAQRLSTAPNSAQTLTTDGSELVVGVVDNGVSTIFASSLGSGWSKVTTGSSPVYPG